ncbi:hypothetical protein M1349_03220 [Patescibacteria group bacterium]|nr:hypothetical protein [Patescibacteria group bacterium]
METERRHAGILNHIVDRMDSQLRTAAIERLISKTDVIYPQDFLQEYRTAMRTGCFPIVISNHQAHIDGVTISVLTKTLVRQANEILPDEQKTKGFLLPVATSLATGDQEVRLRVLYETTRPIIERNGLFPVNLTRPKDVRKYGLPPNKDEFIMNMLMRIDQGYEGIVIFPEGTVQAGRRKDDGKIHGMQAFKEGSIMNVISIAQSRNKDIVFVPVAITGGPDIFNQNKNSPNLKAFGALLPGISSDIKIRVG